MFLVKMHPCLTTITKTCSCSQGDVDTMAFSLKELGLQKFLYGWFIARTKVGRPNLIAYLNRTPTFEWCVVRCGSENEHQKDTCLKKIGLHAQDWTQ